MRVTEVPAPPFLAALDAAGITVRGRPAAKTRVRGIDLAGEAGTWDSTLASAESCWASTFTCDETAADRQKVTNLRLPGQYDERLFQQAGINMPGPYYNWNRWYLPSLGRYMEPDPIAMRGGRNTAYAVDWYNYALGNPVRYIDPSGQFAGMDDCVEAAIGGAIYTAAWLWNLYSACHPDPKPDPGPNQCSAPQPPPEPFRPTPDPTPFQPAPQPGCPPCPPAPPSRIDWVPPSRPHYPCPGSHAHTYVMDQAPDCQCFPREAQVVCL